MPAAGPRGGVEELSRREIQNAGEERHEHPLLVLLAEVAIDLLENVGQSCLERGDGAEQGLRPRPEEGGTGSLSRYVPHNERELAVAQEVLVEISADVAGG